MRAFMPFALMALLALSLLSAEDDWGEEAATTPIGFRKFREWRRKELEKARRKEQHRREEAYRKEEKKWRKQERARPPDPTGLGRNAAIAAHVRYLADPDPEVRQTSAQILGQMGAAEAVPNLIELLNDENVYVKIYAHGALNKLTGKNFGYKNYPAWKSWWDEAERDFDRKRRAFSMPRDYRRTSNTQGLIYVDAGDFVSAARMFLDSIFCGPDVPDYWNNFGLALMELSRHDPDFYSIAMECFLETIEIDPSLPQPFMNIGQCFSRIGKREQAHRWFHLAGERDPEGILWEHFYRLARECIQQGDEQRALQYLDWIRSRAEKIWSREEPRQRDLGGSLGVQEDRKHASAIRFLHSCLPHTGVGKSQ